MAAHSLLLALHAPGNRSNGCFRRVSPVGACSGEGRFTQATAGAQPARRELPFVPLKRPSGLEMFLSCMLPFAERWSDVSGSRACGRS
jgi:hypothetical protein